MKSRPGLWNSWRHVRANGLKSKSRPNRQDIERFDQEANKKLEKIYRQLHENRFRFGPSKAVTKRRPGKTPRPIVVAPIENKIVQRRILDVLIADRSLQPYFSISSSYGTRGAPAAIEDAYRLVVTGDYGFFVRSDVQRFFTGIPRSIPLQVISEVLGDPRFDSLVQRATDVELENLEALGEDADLFPDDEYGVAQGCALSSLLGDILLLDFDREMNGRGVRCLRYVDDFILLGPNEKYTKKAFANAQSALEKFGLRAYDPVSEPEKADWGNTSNGFEFLGCDIAPGVVRPTRKKKRQLLHDIEELLDESYADMADPARLPYSGGALIPTLSFIDRRLRAWGNQYQFCSDRGGFGSLDRRIDNMLRTYLGRYSARRQDHPGCQDDLRRLLGVQLLADCKSDPIPKRLGGKSEA